MTTEKVSFYLPLPCGANDCDVFASKERELRYGISRLGSDLEMRQTLAPVSTDEADTALAAIRHQCNRTYGCALDGSEHKTIGDVVDELIAERAEEVHHA